MKERRSEGGNEGEKETRRGNEKEEGGMWQFEEKMWRRQ